VVAGLLVISAPALSSWAEQAPYLTYTLERKLEGLRKSLAFVKQLTERVEQATQAPQLQAAAREEPPAQVVVREQSLISQLMSTTPAVLLQIGVNYANDYSDGIRGTDEHRVGPARLTGSGLVNPKAVLATALTFFGLAAAAGLVAVVMSGRWWFLAIGVVAILAAWFYTGGKRPYGYAGLGEIAVFVFFGLVATVGTVWLQSEIIPQEAWIAGAGVGLLAVAVLIANNTRDIATDKLVGKRTLSVRIGDRASRILFAVCVLVPFAAPAIYLAPYPLMVFTLLALVGAIPAAIIMLWARSAREMVLALAITSLTALAYGVLMGVAFAF